MTRQYRLRYAGKIDYERELNPQQLEAVLAPPGPALVLAGAGSGKTRVVTYRVARLLETGLSPEDILLLTFTKKAADEMLRRVEGLIETDISRLVGGTFHHVGNLVLRREAQRLGLRPDYTILDRDDAKSLLDTLIREAGYQAKRGKFPGGNIILEVLGYARSTQAGLEKAIQAKCPHFSELAAEIGRVGNLYRERKRLRNYLDFEDLLFFLAELLRECPELAERYRHRFQAILVDEYQDTNTLQAGIVRTLAGDKRNVMAVGDDAQSIYSFRGAAYRNIREFPQDYPGCRIYTVETNYRSSPEILALANVVLARTDSRFHKILEASRSSGPIPVLVRPANVYDQAAFVTQRIAELIEEGCNPREIAVLYRSHYHSMEIQLELTKMGIPFSVRSGLRFFAQAHVKDVLAYLKLIDNPRDEVAWKRVLITVPRLGPRTAEKIWNLLEDVADPWLALEGGQLSPSVSTPARPGFERLCRTLAALLRLAPSGPAGMIDRVARGEYDDYLQGKYGNYRNRLEDIRQLESYAAGYEDLHTFLEELAITGGGLEPDPVEPGGREGAVVLSSIHQAKGLEWRVVFVVWLAEGKFPAGASYGDPEAMEEERRLFYVAVTRCRQELYLLQPLVVRSRTTGCDAPLNPSRFLVDLDPEVYEEWDLYDYDF